MSFLPVVTVWTTLHLLNPGQMLPLLFANPFRSIHLYALSGNFVTKLIEREFLNDCTMLDKHTQSKLSSEFTSFHVI